MKKTIPFLLIFIFSGCSTYSSNLQVGNDQAYTSLGDQRAAVLTVLEYERVPEGAVVKF